MNVAAESQFARTLIDVFAKRRPRRILETGTHLATGTTRIIGQAIREAGIDPVEFISIEVNADFVRQARENAAAAKIPADIRQGLSVPRALLPSLDQIRHEYVQKC